MKVVLDTNIVLSSLLFKKSKLAWIRKAWENDCFIPLINQETIQELLRVLAYPKFRLTTNEIQIMLESYLLYAEIVIMPHQNDVLALPICRDNTDQKFLKLALVGNADILVTGDKDLLILTDEELPFRIETAQVFEQRFQN